MSEVSALVATPAATPAYAPKRGPQARRRPGASTAPPPDLRVAPTHEATVLTFAQLIELYYAVKPCAHMQGAFRKWLGYFQLGELSAWEMSTERLCAGAEYLRTAQGYADSTVNRELSELGSIYKWAIAEKMAPLGFVSPTRGNSGRVKEEMRHVENLKPGEWQRIRLIAKSFRDPLFTAFVWLVMDTGARRGEVADRRWTDFNFDDAAPNLILKAKDTKTDKPRRLYFSHETAALLKRLRPGAEKYRDQLVFKSPRGVQPNQYRKPWARLAKLVGRDDLHLHDLRHLLAADLINAGKGMIPVATLLGHSSLVLQRRYAHLDDKSIRDIQSERLGLDVVVQEFAPVRAARERVAEAAARATPMAEAERLALLAQDAADAAARAATALAAAQEAMRAAMATPPSRMP